MVNKGVCYNVWVGGCIRVCVKKRIQNGHGNTCTLNVRVEVNGA